MNKNKPAIAAIIFFIASIISSASQAAIHNIDLLILHPPKSVLNIDILTRVASMESYANKALENSQATIRFRVVKVAEINIPNPKTDGATLSALRKNLQANALRIKYGADLVTMITPTGPYCGVGYVVRGDNSNTIYPYYKNYGFNIVADRCISSFAHELGHNLGLGHSYKQGSQGGLFSWGRGHGVANNFVTTMAYTGAYNARRLQFFSNPDIVKCNGLKCGAAISQSNGAHAVKAVAASGPQISAWFNSTDPVINNNQAPNANEDFAVTRKDDSVIIDVLKNDLDPDQDDTISLTSVGAAKHGKTSITIEDEIQYIPTPGFVGQDNFEYFINDGHDHPVSTVVTVNVGWGVNYQYYQGAWSQLPDFSLQSPTAEGIAHNFTLEPRLQNTNFGFRYLAQLKVPASGDYQFFLTSDDGSRLSINGNPIINNDGLHGAITKTTTINLTTGMHSIDVDFFQRTGGQRLTVEWQGPGIRRQPISYRYLHLAEPENSFPVATDDKTSTAQDTEITIDVLKNDTDSDGHKLNIVSHSDAQNGIVSLKNNELRYSPNPGFTGRDSFSYQINDDHGGKDTGTVTIHVGQGVAYEYYEGIWNRLPDFNLLTPVATGIQDSFTLQNRNRNNYFAFRFQAGLNVPQDGSYSLYLMSDDGSKLFIDGKLIVNNDGLHGYSWRGRRIQLTAGVHDIEVQYFEKTGRERLNLYWRGPNLGFQKISKQYLQSPGL